MNVCVGSRKKLLKIYTGFNCTTSPTNEKGNAEWPIISLHVNLSSDSASEKLSKYIRLQMIQAHRGLTSNWFWAFCFSVQNWPQLLLRLKAETETKEFREENCVILVVEEDREQFLNFLGNLLARGAAGRGAASIISSWRQPLLRFGEYLWISWEFLKEHTYFPRWLNSQVFGDSILPPSLSLSHPMD